MIEIKVIMPKLTLDKLDQLKSRITEIYHERIRVTEGRMPTCDACGKPIKYPNKMRSVISFPDDRYSADWDRNGTSPPPKPQRKLYHNTSFENCGGPAPHPIYESLRPMFTIDPPQETPKRPSHYDDRENRWLDGRFSPMGRVTIESDEVIYARQRENEKRIEEKAAEERRQREEFQNQQKIERLRQEAMKKIREEDEARQREQKFIKPSRRKFVLEED